MTIQTAVLIETLQALGADVRWASCNIYRPRITPLPPPSPPPARRCSPSKARASDYWDYTHRSGMGRAAAQHDPRRRRRRRAADPSGQARRRDTGALVNDPENEEEASQLLRRDQEPTGQDATWYSQERAAIIGVTEETTTGVHRLNQMMKEKGTLLFPAPSTSTTGHQVEVRQPLRLPRIAGRRHQARTDVMVAGKIAVVAGYGDVGKGSAQALRQRCRPRCGSPKSTRSTPAGGDGRLPVDTMDWAADKADIFVTATGNNVITMTTWPR